MKEDSTTVESKVPLERVVEGLNDLLQLDHDAIGAYEVALENLVDSEHALRLRAFLGDHERHIRDLNDVILTLGGVPANEPHAAAPLRQAVQEIAASGGDEALLTAWRSNEYRIAEKYTEYAREAVFWPPAAKRVIDQNALDEDKHLRWVDGILGEHDANSGVEEGLSRARETLGTVQEQLQRAGRMSRATVAGTLTSAATRLDQFAVDQQSDQGMRGKARRAALKLSDSLEQAALGLQPDDDDYSGPSSGGLREPVERVVREKPVQSVAGTFVVALIVGRLIR